MKKIMYLYFTLWNSVVMLIIGSFVSSMINLVSQGSEYIAMAIIVTVFFLPIFFLLYLGGRSAIHLLNLEKGLLKTVLKIIIPGLLFLIIPYFAFDFTLIQTVIALILTFLVEYVFNIIFEKFQKPVLK